MLSEKLFLLGGEDPLNTPLVCQLFPEFVLGKKDCQNYMKVITIIEPLYLMPLCVGCTTCSLCLDVLLGSMQCSVRLVFSEETTVFIR